MLTPPHSTKDLISLESNFNNVNFIYKQYFELGVWKQNFNI